MPTAYLTNRRYGGWREEMETSLKSSREDWSRASYADSFEYGFYSRQKKVLEHSGYEPQYHSVSRRYYNANAQKRSADISSLSYCHYESLASSYDNVSRYKRGGANESFQKRNVYTPKQPTIKPHQVSTWKKKETKDKEYCSSVDFEKPNDYKPKQPTIKPQPVRDSTLHRVSEYTWKKLEEESQDRQREFLFKYLKEGKFKDETINYKNVRQGDHLFCQGGSGMYEHHFLCTDVNYNGIEIIEYTGPSLSMGASLQSASTLNPFVFAKIKRKSMTFKELQEKETKKRVWPKELERFDVNTVIDRATKKREGERLYHLFENNCEHFVTWCKCGLNTSMQVKPGYRKAWEAAKVVASSGFEAAKRATPTILKAVANLSDEAFSAISSPLNPLGFVAGGLIEAGLAAYSIYNDHKKLKQEIISERQFKVNTVKTTAKATCRFGGGAAGSIIGSAFGPVGTIVGGVIGAGVGHLGGVAAGWCYENAPKIKETFQDYIVAPVKKAVAACASAVSSAVSKVCEGVKSVFNFLFSW